jgi:small redox-active disulfide protein 2
MTSEREPFLRAFHSSTSSRFHIAEGYEGKEVKLCSMTPPAATHHGIASGSDQGSWTDPDRSSRKSVSEEVYPIEPHSSTMPLKIEVLAFGCSKCRLMEVATHAAIEELGIDVDVDKLQDIEEAKRRGVMSQPALFINGKLMVQGRVPSIDEIKEMIVNAQGYITDYSVF